MKKNRSIKKNKWLYAISKKKEKTWGKIIKESLVPHVKSEAAKAKS